MPPNTDDILARFAAWLAEAAAHPHIAEPTAMSVATSGADNLPSARILLLKDYDARGFAFFTSMLGRKSAQLSENPHAALCFHWMPLGRQVRIEGPAQPVSEAEADAYFSSRPRESQIGAWASAQSQPLESREALLARYAEIESQYPHGVPRPPYWGGWRVAPARVEFWQQGAHRLHARECYMREGDAWRVELLNP